jgi:two-component system phosphate regulon sensor histidine kinase PhoR
VGIRGKLFTVSVILILFVGTVSGLYLEARLRAFTLDRIEAELGRHADTARVALEAADGAALALDPLADRLAAATGARVSIVDASGALRGDSEVPEGALAQAESHKDRPEVAAAMRAGRGVARRRSATVDAELLYVALPAHRPGFDGVVRVAMPLADVDRVVGNLRVLFAVTGCLGLFAAVFMSGLASHLMSRTLRRLADRAAAMSVGAPGERLAASSADELSGLAGSFNRMATEIEQAVTTLAEERNRFEAVLDGLSEAVIALDADGRIELVNRATTALLGLPRSPVGLTLLEAVRNPTLGELVARTRPGQLETVEFELAGAVPHRVMARVTRPRSGTGVVMVLHDVTEIRKLEGMKRDFVANVSHELRTPVAIIRANAETLLDGALDDKTRGRDFVEAMLRHADRLSGLISDLLDLSRIEAGRYGVKLQPVRVRAALQRVVELADRHVRDKGHAVSIDAPDALWVEADPRALEQIFTNLVDNAIKYTPPGGRLLLRAAPSARGVRVEVEDDGPGIEPRHRDRIFERFYRVDPGRSRDVGGTGLGLSIVKHLAEAMGGAVGVDAAPVRGSLFWLELAATTPPSAVAAAAETRAA